MNGLEASQPKRAFLDQRKLVPPEGLAAASPGRTELNDSLN